MDFFASWLFILSCQPRIFETPLKYFSANFDYYLVIGTIKKNLKYAAHIEVAEKGMLLQ